MARAARDGSRVLNAVPASADFRERIMRIPTRTWDMAEAQELATDLTMVLKTDTGTWELNPMQAIGLKEAHMYDGLAMSAPVGKGKGLLSLLMLGWMESRRGIIILPAHLRQRTLRKMLPQAAANWKLHRDLVYRPEEVIHSAQSFQTQPNKNLLWDLDPDDIIIDEQQYWKNEEATRVGRLLDYLEYRIEQKRPARLFFMTGNFFSYSVLDIYAVLKYALPKYFIFPYAKNEAKTWAAALDEEVTTRSEAGALKMFMTPAQRNAYSDGSTSPAEQVDIARDAFSSRLSQMPGVIMIRDSSATTSLCYDFIHPGKKDYPKPPAVIQEAFYNLRRYAALPGDEWISDGSSLWRAVQELSAGGYNVWDWKPHIENSMKELWCFRLKLFKRFIRHSIKKHREAGLDSELAVTNAVRSGVLPNSDVVLDDVLYKDTYGLWMNRDNAMLAPGPDMKPPTKWVWLSDFMADWVYERVKNTPTVVWVKFPALGKRIEEKYGLKYYGAGARTVENETGKKSIVCSITAQGTGNNMQMFHRALFTSPMKSATLWEQGVGREHRQGQKEDCFVDVIINARELWSGWCKAVALANFQSHLQGPQKLIYGDKINEPTVEEVQDWMHGTDLQWADPRDSLVNELDGILADVEDEETR